MDNNILKYNEKIRLPAPYSQRLQSRNISAVDDLIDFEPIRTSTTKGINYVGKYVEEEQEELLKSSTSYISNMLENELKIDDVSVGTSSIQPELYNEELHVYNTFDFSTHLKTNLSITDMKDYIISMIETNSVIVIEGPTGCGKTTQVPQYILDSCYQKKTHCNIIVTQPRRIAASSIAKRVSQERKWPVGTLVGYKIGMMNCTSKDTRLTYCTTGVLLRVLIYKKHMLEYTHIILDEVHERNQELDFLLLVIRKLLRTNSRNVKVILMSATFNVEKFANYFSSPVGNKLEPAPVISIVKQNFYNTKIYYLCHLGMLGELPEILPHEPKVTRNLLEFCVRIIIVLDELDMKVGDAENDIGIGSCNRHVVLIFLPGIYEIEELHNMLMSPKYKSAKWDIVVLHSSLTSEEQFKIFQQPPENYRRIILSTNIAESSITVPDVKFVIDFCLTKQLVTDPQTNFQSLELSWASKVNCKQRAGRTGRVMDGRVYRLVPKNFYYSVLPEEGNPEMLRAPLENVILQAKILNMGEPKAILALSLDPPDLSNIERTILILKESGALLNNNNKTQVLDGELTDLGRIMAALPLNINVTKLIVLGHLFSVLRDTIIIGCSMTIKDMFCSPFRKKLLAYNVKLTWANDSESDCISFLNVYKVWTREKANRRLNNRDIEKRWAKRQFVQIKVLREIEALVLEVTQTLETFNIVESVGINKVKWDDEIRPLILKIVIAGAFYPNYCMKRQNTEELKEGHKILNGLDITKTVYLQGWPIKQPGFLYARKIQKLFQPCLNSSVGKVIVSFKSTRLYVQFNKDYIDEERKIPLSMYRAIKMRRCDIPIKISLLSEKKVVDFAKQMNFEVQPTEFLNKNVSIKEDKRPAYVKPNLPGFDISCIPIKLVNIINPGHFWVNINDKDTHDEIKYIREVLNRKEYALSKFNSLPEIDTLVAVPLKLKEHLQVEYYRGIIKNYVEIHDKTFALCQLIDIGYTTKIHINEIRKITNAKSVINIPALALECVLANIQPSTIHGYKIQWSEEAELKFHELIGNNENIFGEIYSVVNSVIALTLISVIKDKKFNINEILIDTKLAIVKEESYLSQRNNNIRKNYKNMNTTEILCYEKMQYDDCYDLCNDYPDPPEDSECISTVHLRGPFSPLECNLQHLTIAGRDKKICIENNSVNSVILDNNWEEQQENLLVAGSINQNVANNSLILHNTTLLPAIPGLISLLVLIFTPRMELRRNSLGSHFIGALCGLGYDSSTKESIFPEHDMEINFDVEITLDDLQDINRLRYWMNIGMQISENIKGHNNFMEMITCQNKIEAILSKLINKNRKKQNPEMVGNFYKWALYDESLFLKPYENTMIKNNIYNLHWALELKETDDELEELSNHLKELRILASENDRNTLNTEICCKFCKATVYGIARLREHLYTSEHKQNEKKWPIKL
ncbi:PREDICTED: probable ATP-dependent RNA helicase spindle-E [Polistes canadensis]|uniref:probable ATP-dependent RNA helicase spindle-E n=1 Tax=Polistes canadensis TaxID=91411 RepID=UPI000718DB17|nr:PREDICTED: probable ATP-dependent RNA helicase spindle-E [Polistes canadensis]XP_014605715.1 PREDICTED: probable ATP-dependent RNA helicase spindle-E [Polistes canadensis]